MVDTNIMFTFAALRLKQVELSVTGLRGALLLGNANNGGNAGSLYLNGNNGVSNASANRGAFLNSLYL